MGEGMGLRNAGQSGAQEATTGTGHLPWGENKDSEITAHRSRSPTMSLSLTAAQERREWPSNVRAALTHVWLPVDPNACTHRHLQAGACT